MTPDTVSLRADSSNCGSTDEQAAMPVATALRPILVVDDSPTARNSVTETLRSEGWQVIVADDALSALSLVLECRPLAVVADVHMPRLDGFQTCALLKACAASRALPVIMVSSRMGPLEQARSQVAGADGYLEKPVRSGALTALLARCGCRPPLADAEVTE